MCKLERFGVSMEGDLLTQFDELANRRGSPSRSEAIRDMVRKELVQEEWGQPGDVGIGTITIVYEHQPHDLSSILSELQHQFHGEIICTTHIHMDEDNCLEVIIVRGANEQIRQIANTLISTKGVKHGHLCCATTGKTIR